jgi:arabinofuranosyltransferase
MRYCEPSHGVTSSSHSALQLILLILLPATVFSLLLFKCLPFFADDAFISLRYAERLLDGKGLTWNDGERVEGYSNLLWVLVVALFGKFGMDLEIAGHVVCILATVLACGALVYLANQKQLHYISKLSAVLALVTSWPVVYWTAGGLEATLHMALITWVAVIGWLRFYENKIGGSVFILSLLLGLISINRPDGAIFIGVFSLLFLLPNSQETRKEAVYIFLLSLILPICQVLFRIYYYGDPLPNTYYAKVAINEKRFWGGLTYLSRELLVYLPIFAATALCGALSKSNWRNNLFVIGFFSFPAVTWLTFVAIGGGDFFVYARHIVPVTGLFIIPLMLLLNHSLATRMRSAIAITATLAVIGYQVHYSTLPNQAVTVSKELSWYRHYRGLGYKLHELFADTNPQPLIAVTGAGAIPYYSKLPTVDMLGLNDPYLTKNKPDKFGYGMLAHDLFRPDYALERSPDIIIFNDGVAKYDFGLTFQKQFQDTYHHHGILLSLRIFNSPPVTWFGSVWVRNDSPALEDIQNVSEPAKIKYLNKPDSVGR